MTCHSLPTLPFQLQNYEMKLLKLFSPYDSTILKFFRLLDNAVTTNAREMQEFIDAFEALVLRTKHEIFLQ